MGFTTTYGVACSHSITLQTSTHLRLRDFRTPSPSPKHAKCEARSPSSTLEILDSAAQRTAPTPGTSTRRHFATTAQHTEGAQAVASPHTLPPMKSPNSRYPDGNVVIKGDATYYKLHSSRLAWYCVYFNKLFADDADTYEDRCAKVEGCPVCGQTRCAAVYVGEPESDVAAVVKYVCMPIGARS